MTTPFVNSLRTSGAPIVLGGGNGDVLRIRVEVPESWNTVRVDAPATEPVRAVKVHVLDRLRPTSARHDEFVMKLGGFEVIDENATLADVGARNGSTFLLTSRRRRPFR